MINNALIKSINEIIIYIVDLSTIYINIYDLKLTIVGNKK